MKPLALVAALVLALLGLAGPATAEDPAPVVTWPEITAFNPEQTSYVFHVENPGTDVVRAYWGGHVQEIAGSGDVEMTFPTDDQAAIRVVRCPAVGGSCSDLAVSPVLSVFRAFHVEGLGSRKAGGPLADNFVNVTLLPGEIETDVTWRLVDSHGNEVATGTDVVTPTASGAARVHYDVPASAESSIHTMTVALAGDSAIFGHLVGTGSGYVMVDTSGPGGTLSVSRGEFYPAQDGYLDTVDIIGRFSHAVSSRLEIVSSAGDVVAQWPGAKRYHWDGKDQDGHRLPADTYTVRIFGVDSLGNENDRSTTLVLSDQRLLKRTWTRTVTATDSISSTWVGSCSRLQKPASRGWAESFGLYSQTACTRAAQSPVVVYSGAWLPETVRPYRRLAVSMYGGGARGHSSAYVVMGLRRAGDDSFQNRAQFAGGVGWHRMPAVSASPYVRYDHGHPFVIWQTGLSEGSRYDVRSYRISLGYTVLR